MSLSILIFMFQKEKKKTYKPTKLKETYHVKIGIHIVSSRRIYILPLDMFVEMLILSLISSVWFRLSHPNSHVGICSKIRRDLPDDLLLRALIKQIKIA